MRTDTAELLQQHVIDPEVCIRCNTCEATCPVGAVTHDSRNYVVDADKCNHCMACVPPCPTGSIDHWLPMLRSQAYSLQEQLSWDELPAPQAHDAAQNVSSITQMSGSTAFETASSSLQTAIGAQAAVPESDNWSAMGATLPPWSAAHPYTNLHGPKSPTTATVVGNMQVNEAGTDNETHHIVLDFGSMPFPVLEGQSIGIVSPGVDASGRPHHARQYSIASPRNGERPGYNNLSLTVKRVVQDHQGQPVKGVASNYLCDLKTGDAVQVIGPFGSFEGGKLVLFFGARTQQELPYFGPLQKLPQDFIDIHFAFSRTPGQPKRYVQDAMREAAPQLATLLQDAQTHFYVCGLKSMEQGVLQALRDIALGAGLDWTAISQDLKQQGRLQLETY